MLPERRVSSDTTALIILGAFLAVVLTVLVGSARAGVQRGGGSTTRPAGSTPGREEESAGKAGDDKREPPDEPAAAAGPEVLAVQGTAQRLVIAGGKAKWLAVKVGDKLGPLAVLRTGLGSKVELKLGDGALATVFSATKMGIATLGGVGEPAAARLTLKYGSMKLRSYPMADTRPLVVETRTGALAFAGIKGSISYQYGRGLLLGAEKGAWQTAQLRTRAQRLAEPTGGKMAPGGPQARNPASNGKKNAPGASREGSPPTAATTPAVGQRTKIVSPDRRLRARPRQNSPGTGH